MTFYSHPSNPLLTGAKDAVEKIAKEYGSENLPEKYEKKTMPRRTASVEAAYRGWMS